MTKRIINCYVYPEDNNIIVRLIEIQEQNSSRLAEIAKHVHYSAIEGLVQTAFNPNFIQEINQAEPEVLDAVPGMRAAHQLIGYVNDTIGDREPDEYKAVLIKQLEDLSYQNTEIFSDLLMSYAAFNFMPWQVVLQNNMLGENIDRRYNAAVQANTYPHGAYRVNDHQFVLPNDPQKLLMLLGSIDGALHRHDKYAERHNLEIDIRHFSQKPETENRTEIVTKALNEQAYKGTNQEFSTVINNLIKEQYQANQEQYARFSKAMLELEVISRQKPASLTKPVRDRLYPDISTAKFLDDYCKDDLLMADMLDPEISFVEASQKVTNKLRQQLSKKRKIGTEEKLQRVEAGVHEQENDLSSEDVRNILATAVIMHNPQNPAQLLLTIATAPVPEEPRRKFASPIHKDIAHWFERFTDVRDLFWQTHVNKLYGYRANDGGYYTSNYTEILLMKEADMHLNQHGFMELDLFKEEGSTYNQFYAKGKENYDLLENELRKAFDLLGLNFQDGIDFHNDSIVFDRASTKSLMNRGMHYTEDYCKKLMQASHRQRLFAPNKDGNNALIQSDFLPNEMKCLIANQVDPDIHPREDWGLQSMRLA